MFYFRATLFLQKLMFFLGGLLNSVDVVNILLNVLLVYKRTSSSRFVFSVAKCFALFSSMHLNNLSPNLRKQSCCMFSSYLVYFILVFKKVEFFNRTLTGKSVLSVTMFSMENPCSFGTEMLEQTNWCCKISRIADTHIKHFSCSRKAISVSDFFLHIKNGST